MFNILYCIIAIPLGLFICLALIMLIDVFIIKPLGLDRSDE